MPHNAAAIEVCKLARDATCEGVPFRLVKKSGMSVSVLDVLLDEMLDAISGKNTDSIRNFNK